MSNFDNSRREDMKLIDERLHSKKTSKRGKRYLQKSRAAILRQEKDPNLKNLRSRLLRATQAQDTAAVMQIEEQLQAYDRRHGYDQNENVELKPRT
jgi:hypothetical protein